MRTEDPSITTHSLAAGRARTFWRVGLTFGPVGVLLLLAVILRMSVGIGIGDFTQDHVQLLGGAFYAGAYSTLGLLLWAVTAAICLFTALQLAPGRREARRLFLSAAGLSVLLLLDDMLLLHEIVLPRYVGIPQNVVLLMLIVLAMAFVVAFRRQILARRAGYMMAAAAFFALSIGLDMVPRIPARYLLEDGAKMFGIAAWCSFWVQRCALEFKEPADLSVTPGPRGD